MRTPKLQLLGVDEVERKWLSFNFLSESPFVLFQVDSSCLLVLIACLQGRALVAPVQPQDWSFDDYWRSLGISMA
jgi:hypothetical protein